MHTNCSLVCLRAQFNQIFQAGRSLCVFATEADLKQNGKGKEESQLPSMKYVNRLPDTERESLRYLTGLADSLRPVMQNSVFVLGKALRDVPNCH